MSIEYWNGTELVPAELEYYDGVESVPVLDYYPVVDFSELSVYDDFANSENPPSVNATGQAWNIFSGPGEVRSGYYDSVPGSGASYLECDSRLQPVNRMGATWRFNNQGGTKTTSGTLALVTWADGGIFASGFGRRTSAHVTITSTTIQWYVRDVVNGGEVTLLSTQTINPPLASNVDYSVEISMIPGKGYAVLGDGREFEWVDARIAQYDGERFTCWEPFYGNEETNTRCEIKKVWAEGVPWEPPELPTRPAGLVDTAYNRIASVVTSNTVAMPANVQEGDLLLLAAVWLSQTATPSPPAGWTQLDGSSRGGINARAWFKIATEDDLGSSVTVTTTVTAPAMVQIFAFNNLRDIFSRQRTNKGSGTATFPFMTPVTYPNPGEIIMHILSLASASNGALIVTPPSGMQIIASSVPTDANARMGFVVAIGTNYQEYPPEAVPGGTYGLSNTTYYGVGYYTGAYTKAVEG